MMAPNSKGKIKSYTETIQRKDPRWYFWTVPPWSRGRGFVPPPIIFLWEAICNEHFKLQLVNLFTFLEIWLKVPKSSSSGKASSPPHRSSSFGPLRSKNCFAVLFICDLSTCLLIFSAQSHVYLETGFVWISAGMWLVTRDMATWLECIINMRKYLWFVRIIQLLLLQEKSLEKLHQCNRAFNSSTGIDFL